MSPPPQLRTRLIAALVALAVINGAWLAYAWLSWVPRDLLEVVALPPAQVDGHATLRFVFNLDMVGAEGLGQPPTASPEITPAVAGSWTWTDARTLTFSPRENLPAASAFNIRLACEAMRAASGLRLAHEVRLAVHTPALSLQGARLESFAPEGRAIVVLDFNQAVDPRTIAHALVVTAAVAAPERAAAPPPQVVALETAPSARIRLRIESGERFELAAALLALPGGTCGSAGPLGLAAAWQTRLDLGHVLGVRALAVDAPPRGEITIHLSTGATEVTRDCLADALTISPPVAYRVHPTAQGLDLVGAFSPGADYRIAVAARYPEEHPLHPLAAYPAGSSWLAAIPTRRPGVWLAEQAVRDGHIALGAQALAQATVEVLKADAEQPLRTGMVAFQVGDGSGTGEAMLDGDALFADLPNGRYRLRVRASDAGAVLAESAVTIDDVALRPGDLELAAGQWLAQNLAGDGEADVSARLVRLAR